MVSMIHRISTRGWMGLGAGVVGIAVLVNLHFSRPGVKEINGGHSAAFRSKEVKDPLKTPSDDEVITISEPEFRFTSQVPLGAKVVQISFHYRCEPECEKLWLSLLTENNQSLDILLQHPLFDYLNWFYVDDQGLMLYQKEVRYKNISEFLAVNSGRQLLIERDLAELLGLQFPDMRFLEEAKELNGAEFIITRYQPPTMNDDWFYFSKTLDIRNAQRNEQNQLQWKIINQADNKPLPKVLVARIEGEYQ